MNLVQRVQDILLKPQETWPVIEAEASTTASIYKEYLIYLAAIPAIAGFIGMSLIGVGAFGFSYRVPLMTGLVSAMLHYVMSLAMVFVLALIVDALAPSFGGTKNRNNALKLAAYACTAAFVAGIFSLIPSLGILGLLVALYSIYLIYTGLPTLMKCPADKAVGYTVVVVICGIVAGVIIGAVAGAAGVGGFGYNRSAMFDRGNVSFGDTRDVNVDAARAQAAIAKLAEVGKQMQQAAQTHPETASAPVAEQAAVAAQAAGAPFPPQDLRALLPEAIGDLKRTSIESGGNGSIVSTANAKYGSGAKEIQLGITDSTITAAFSGFASMAGTMDKETDSSVEKRYTENKRVVGEKYQKDGSSASYDLYLPNGVAVEAKGRGVDIATLKNVVNSTIADKLEAMTRPAK